MFTWMAIGTVWFWVFSIIEFVLLTVCAENEIPIGGLVSAAIYLALLNLFGSVSVFAWIGANHWRVLIVLGAYVAIGAVWAILKWTRVCVGVARAHAEAVSQRRDVDTVCYKHDRYSLPLKAGLYQRPIVTWMALWPTSLLWFVIEDVMYDLFSNICEGIKFIFQNIADRIMANVGGYVPPVKE